MDSPRGRIYLMDGVQTGEIPLNATTSQHFDTCLGCFACVTTCPSGVQYDKLITATRPQVERQVARPPGEVWLRQLLFALLPYPNRLRLLMLPVPLYQKSGLQAWVRGRVEQWGDRLSEVLPLPPLAKRLLALEGLLPPITLGAFREPLRRVVPAQGPRRYRVGMVLGCVQRLFNPGVNEATVRVLAANGCEVVIPWTHGCCGAVTHHQGEEAKTQELARALVDCFSREDLDAIVINASGCGHTLKEYGEILRDDPVYGPKAAALAAKVRDVQEFLAQVGLTAPLHPLKAGSNPEGIPGASLGAIPGAIPGVSPAGGMAPTTIVAYQDACHMIHGQNIQEQPRQLLRQIPGVEVRDPVDAALCCGSAGVYNIFQPEVAGELGQQKARNLANTGAEVIASANIGCFVQISKYLQAQGRSIPVLHPMELLDRSIRGVGLSGEESLG